MTKIVIALLVSFSVLSACSATPQGQPRFSKVSANGTPIPVNQSSQAVQQLLGSEFKRWKGTPHRLGGTGKGGFDCSGFARYLFTTLFAVDLPRSTKGQIHVGYPVERQALRPGDLVFFQPPSYPRHVGVYVGDGEFIHASSSKGVVRSRLNSPYWKRHYWTARRIIVPTDRRV